MKTSSETMETKSNPHDHDGFHRFIERFAFWKRLPQPFRMMAAIVIGCALIVAGIIMLFTPGQGLLTILAGLAVIGTEFHWARKSVQWCVRQFMAVRDYVLNLWRSKRKDALSDGERSDTSS